MVTLLPNVNTGGVPFKVLYLKLSFHEFKFTFQLPMNVMRLMNSQE